MSDDVPEKTAKEIMRLSDEFAAHGADALLLCDLCTKERTADNCFLVIRVDEEYQTAPVGFHVCTTCFAYYDNDEEQIQKRLDSQN